MVGFAEIWSVFSILRESGYESVFHLGDTALQFTADLIHGPDNPRHEQYSYRQIDQQQKKAERKKPAQKKISSIPKKPAQKTRPIAAERPLNISEKKYFSEITRRQQGKSIIEHWKRRKYMLSHPHKRSLISAEKSLDAVEAKQHIIETEMKSISSKYQKQRLPKLARKRVRGRSR